MKTYTKTIETPRLVISHDEDAENPRRFAPNLGYFITVDRDYTSPDRYTLLENIIINSGAIASSQEDHIKRITESFNDCEPKNKVVEIYPVTKYEHGGVSYSLGTVHGFDNSNNGFYIITEKTLTDYEANEKSPEKWKDIIAAELDEYTAWANGEMYQFELFDDNGDVIDSCGGFRELSDIAGYLGGEWKDEDLTEYILKSYGK
jgi:hypothetical protein